MSFWDEHAKAEAAHDAAQKANLPPSSQNAPARCDLCGHKVDGVLFGSCARCYAAWEKGD